MSIQDKLEAAHYIPCAIDELRSMVRFYAWMNESFNQSFTHEELLKLYRYCTQSEKAYSELDECPDTWTEEQIQEALNWDGVTGRRTEYGS